jgi:PAS domain S-box-containing protein
MKTLGQSEETYRLLVESMPGMVWLGRSDGFIEYLTPHALDYLGLPAEEVCGWGWRKLIHPDDAPQAQVAWDRAVQSETPYEAEYRMRRNDGTYRWQAARSQPLRAQDGQVHRWIGTCADIHDKKRAEEDSSRLAAIVESSEDAIIGKTLHGIITSWNEGAQRLFGYTADEMVGQPVSRLIPADRLDEETDILARLQRGERVKHFETVRRRKDGRLVDVSLSSSPIRDTSGRIVGASKIARDMSGRKRAERILQEGRERFEGVIESAMDAIISVDENQRVVLFNTAAGRMFRCAASEALGKPLDRFIPARLRTAHAAHVRAFAETGMTSRAMGNLGSLNGVRADGEEFPIEAAISQVTVGGAKLFTVILRDITERKNAEAAIQHGTEQLRALTAQLHRAREEEAIRIARDLHDQLGRCLTTMKMDVRWIERELASGEVTSESACNLREKAREIAQAIDETVQTVRAIATQLRPGLLDDLGLAAAIKWQAEDFQKRSGISCALTLTEEDPRVSRDQGTALFRIFQEILTNVARHAQATKVWIYLGEEHGAIVLEVEDDGVGISPAELAERRSLGLLGMRERAAAFGGAVEIAGAPGQGTTVMVRMPVLKINHENSDR